MDEVAARKVAGARDLGDRNAAVELASQHLLRPRLLRTRKEPTPPRVRHGRATVLPEEVGSHRYAHLVDEQHAGLGRPVERRRQCQARLPSTSSLDTGDAFKPADTGAVPVLDRALDRGMRDLEQHEVEGGLHVGAIAIAEVTDVDGASVELVE